MNASPIWTCDVSHVQMGQTKGEGKDFVVDLGARQADDYSLRSTVTTLPMTVAWVPSMGE